MNLPHLQQALARMQSIQTRFEGQIGASAHQAAADFSGFDDILKTSLQESRAADTNQIKAPKFQLQGMVEKKAEAYGVDSNLIKAMVQTESAFNPNAVSPVGAKGLMQLMPGTARELGVNNSFNPEENVDGGVRYMKSLMNRYQSLPNAIAAYNAGPGNVDKYGGIPPFTETTNYVNRVMDRYKAYSAQDSRHGGGV